MPRVIYEPRGRAREYSPLAANLYTGCGHHCSYCYAANIRGNLAPSPRKDILKWIEEDAIRLSREKNDSQILLCFLCDPYQPIEEDFKITSKTIDILMKYNLHFSVLTKGGIRSVPDMQKYKDYPFVSYGVTLFTLDSKIQEKYEPSSAIISDRIEALSIAKSLGIRTWVSVEPVFNPNDALEMIKKTANMVDVFKVGKLNHNVELERQVDWKDFVHRVVDLLEELGNGYYIKKDLKKFW